MLTYFEKIALICGCTGVLGMAVFLTSCLMCQCCWLNKKSTKRQRINDGNKKCYDQDSLELCFMDAEKNQPPSIITRSFSPTGLKSIAVFHKGLTSDNSVSNVTSDTDSLTGFTLLSTNETKIPESKSKQDLSKLGSVTLTLQFKDITNEYGKTFPQLKIDLKKAHDLPTRSYGGRLNPYFIISLYDVKVFSEKKRGKIDALPIIQFHSSKMKKSLNPEYNETFLFPMENHDMKECVLLIEAWDKDKLANDSILGDAHYILKIMETALLKEPPKETNVYLKLEEAKYNYGHLQLGLCYLPTAEQMTVSVLKVKNLMLLKESNEGVDYYVQATVLFSGKISEMKNTSCQPPSKLLVFNELLMFHIPVSKFDDMVLLIAIYSKAKSESDKGENLRAKGKNSCIGKIVIGATSRKPSSDHWNAIRNSPRRQLIRWHELR